jgi:hypothetical protein
MASATRLLASRRWRSAFAQHQGTLVALGVLALLTYLFLWRLWATNPQDRATFPEKSDLTEGFFPPRYFVASTLAQGGFPLWNPHIFSGYPQFADPQSATFYPIELAFALLAGARFSLDTLAASIGLHFFLAGAFAFFFFRRLLGRWPPALLGAVVFEFGGFLTGFAPLQISELEAAIWLPATLLAITWAIDHRSTARMAVAGLALCQVFLTGRPQSYLTIAPLSLAWLGYYAYTHGWRWRAIAGHAALLGCIALGAAAVQWLPTLELTRLSLRSQFTYDSVAFGGFAVPELAALLGPGYVGSTPLFVTLYCGTFTLVLAGVAVARRRGLFWIVMGSMFLLGSLGHHLILLDGLYLIERLGFPGYLRDVERLALGINFCLAALAGLGLAQLSQERAQLARPVLAAAGAVAGLCAVALWLQPYLGASIGQTARAASALALTLLLLGLGLLALWLAGPRWALGQLAVLALVAVDLLSANQGRFYVINQTLQAQEIAHAAAAPAGADPVYRIAADQFSSKDFGSVLGLDTVSGMTSLQLASYNRLLSDIDTYRRNILLNVEVVATSGQFNDPSYRLAGVWEDYRYYAFQPTHTRVYFVQHVLSAATEQAAADLIAAPNFDQWNSAVALGPFAVDDHQPLAPEETAAIEARSANSLQIKAVTQARRLLVIANADYPGWRAWLDGQPAPILKTNVALQGVLVPPGQHTLRLEFLPTTFVVGLGLSAVTWLGVLAWLLVEWRRGQSLQAITRTTAA